MHSQKELVDGVNTVEPVEAGCLTIIVADDSPVDRHLVERLLALPMPVRLIPAENGAAALHMIARHDPDLVLTDLSMPGMIHRRHVVRQAGAGE